MPGRSVSSPARVKKAYACPNLWRSNALAPRLNSLRPMSTGSCSSVSASATAAWVSASATPFAFSGAWAAWNSFTACVVIGP